MELPAQGSCPNICTLRVSVLAGSSQGEPWAWQDLAALATLQSHRIDALTGDTS